MSSDRETPVVLSRIYTRTGDDGTTALGDMSRARKTDPRLAAYADTDEANSAIGVAVTLGQLPADITRLLVRIQNELFDVGADLCNPVTEDPAYPPLRIDASYITGLEQACDDFNEGLPVLRSFVLPGGSAAAALLHVARTVVRRAERSTWAAFEAHGDTHEPADCAVPQQAVRPAVHPGQTGQRAGRRPALEARRRALRSGRLRVRAARSRDR